MRTIREVEEWRELIAEEYGDPAAAVCQLFARYVEGDHRPKSATELFELFCFYDGEDGLVLWLGPELVIPLDISSAGPEIYGEGELLKFGAERVAPGLWSLNPSLNMPGEIHGFVTLYDVPHPAPWEQLIVLAG